MIERVLLEDIWEKYRIKFVKGGRAQWKEIWAVRGVNLRLHEQEVLGIIGKNGSGKTTLLRVIAGIFAPDKGQRIVTGKIGYLLELGAGLSAELTGVENIVYCVKSYGLDTKRIDALIHTISEESGIGDFIDAPLKYYSSGMYARLAFSLALSIEPDIFLIDDILSVGDTFFQQQSFAKIRLLKERGCAVVLVSHDMSLIQDLCDRVVVMEEGKIIYEGSAQWAVGYYVDKEIPCERPESVPASETIAVTFPVFQQTPIPLQIAIKRESSDENYVATFERNGPTLTAHCTVPGFDFVMDKRQDDNAISFRLEAAQDITELHRISLQCVMSIDRFGLTGFAAGTSRIESFPERDGPIQLGEHILDEFSFLSRQGFIVFRSLGSFYSAFIQDGNIHFSVMVLNSSLKSQDKALQIDISVEKSYQPSQKVLKYCYAGKETGIAVTNSKVHLLHKKAQLTSGLGLYFSLKKGGIWFDSTQSRLNIRRNDDHIVEIERNWFLHTIFQQERYIIDDNRISFRIVLRTGLALEDCLLYHCGCMLQSAYDQYQYDGCQGKLSPDFSSVYEYSPFMYLNLPAKKSLTITAPDESALIFETISPECNFVLENSDAFYKSRIVKIERYCRNRMFKEAEIAGDLYIR